MPPDPLTSPIAALTSHPILSAEDEADLIVTLRAGALATRRKDLLLRSYADEEGA
jgi:hypothetical protein